MNWITKLSEEGLPLVTLSDKGKISKKSSDYKSRTLRKIRNAKLISKGDALNFAYLVGSYLGKNTDLDDISIIVSDSEREKYLKLIQALDRDVVSVLERMKPNTDDKSSAEYIAFYKAPSNDVQTVLRYMSQLVNEGIGISEQEGIDPIRMAMIRPIVRYEYKVQARKLNTKSDRDSFFSDYSISNANLQKLAKKEIRRVYTPIYLGYTGIGLGLLFITLTIINRRRR